MTVDRLYGLAALAVLVSVSACGSEDITEPPDVVLPPDRPRVEGTWTTGPSLPRGSYSPTVVDRDGALWVVGGALGQYGSDEDTSDEVLVLEPGAQSWTSGPTYPVDGLDIGMVMVGDTLMGIGGLAFPGKRWPRIFLLGPEQNEWLRRDMDGMPRGSLAVVMAAGIVVTIDPRGSGEVHRYDPGTGSWSEGAQVPRDHFDFEVVTDGQRVYTVFGQARLSPFTANGIIDAYDPVADEWTTITVAPLPRDDAGVAFVDGRIHVFGGTDATLTLRTNHLVYDLDEDVWYDAPDLPEAVAGLESVVIDGEIWTVGGWNRFLSPELRTSVRRFTPSG